MLKLKKYMLTILLSLLISIMNYNSIISLSENIPKVIIRNDIIFYMYRNSVISNLAFFIIIPACIFICINIIKKYFMNYTIIRYCKKSTWINNLIKDIILNYVIFSISVNVLFIISFILVFDATYINLIFIIYIVLSLISQIVGISFIMMVIVLVNIIINKIIISSFNIFGILTLFKAIKLAIKTNIVTIDEMLFFKNDFNSYFNGILMHITYIIFFVIFSAFIYSLTCIVFERRDFLYND